MNTEPEKLLAAEQVADLMGVDVRWVVEQARCGRISSFKLGRKRRFRWSDVERDLEAFREDASHLRLARVGGKQ